MLSCAPFATGLAAFGEQTAVITVDGELSYADLAARVAAMASRLGSPRRLVLLAGANTLDSLIGYLAALSAGHPVLLVPGETNPHSLIAVYDPDVVVIGSEIEERRAGTKHDLHPDLALLLSTSGSTGAPKLVRLSGDNLQSNAAAIADYLAIRPGDRAATTLPMHYCYGLSVVNSHLLRGATLLLTDLSVAEPGFWQLFREQGGTSFAGVPYTFDLLDRIGFSDMRLPTLRHVTQAGGRLEPGRVKRYAAMGKRDGWELFVMYGQTEATARMAYLPPDLAATAPHCIGVPIPGGSFDLDLETGELLYAGPNVMLGYATSPADLALGRTVHRLRTGDLARRTPEGLYEIVGRRSEFLKLFGLRLDPRQIEATLRDIGVSALCAGVGDRLGVLVQGAADPAMIGKAAGLPPHAIHIRSIAALPMLANGKPNHAAAAALLNEPVAFPRDRAALPSEPAAFPRDRTALPSEPAAFPSDRAAVSPNERAEALLERSGRLRPAEPAGADPAVRAVFLAVLGVQEVSDDRSFVELGGDSLSYVEMSLRLEKVLGRLPADWHTMPIQELRPATSTRRWLDTSAALRALSIVLIVGTHAKLFAIAGGAHLLLGVAGFNFGRFHLTARPAADPAATRDEQMARAARTERLGRIGRSVGRIAGVSITWIALMYLVTDAYSLRHVFLANYLFGPKQVINDFWFIEALVYILLVLLVGMSIPWIDRAERRYPFGLPMVVMAVGLITRYHLVPGPKLPTPATVFWLFALGWAAAKAADARQRLIVTAATLATVPGFFNDLKREAFVVAGLALVIWVPAIPSTRRLSQAVGILAGSSLYIYLTHWQVFPLFAKYSPLLAVVASLIVGVGYSAVSKSVGRHVSIRRLLARREYESHNDYSGERDNEQEGEQVSEQGLHRSQRFLGRLHLRAGRIRLRTSLRVVRQR